MKKAQAVVFNWVYILIAGVLILLIFTGFITKYRSFQEKRIEIEILKDLDNVFLSLQSSPYEAVMSLELPKPIKFDADNLIIGKSKLKTNKIIAGKANKQAIIWSPPLNLPFRITNLYFILDPKETYYIIYENEQDKELLQEIIPDIKNIKFSKSNQGNSIKVIPSQDINLGKVVIKNKEYDYYGREMVFLALFSQDYYPSLQKKVLDKYNDLAKIYIEKANLLKQKNPLCIQTYQDIISALNKGIKNYNILNELNGGLSCPTVF